MYQWRKMTEKQRMEILKLRGQHGWPSHSPPHFDANGWTRFHLSAANYEHIPIIGKTPDRITSFSADLCGLFLEGGCTLHAWCVLPNH
jgi:putative transposase